HVAKGARYGGHGERRSAVAARSCTLPRGDAERRCVGILRPWPHLATPARGSKRSNASQPDVRSSEAGSRGDLRLGHWHSGDRGWWPHLGGPHRGTAQCEHLECRRRSGRGRTTLCITPRIARVRLGRLWPELARPLVRGSDCLGRYVCTPPLADIRDENSCAPLPPCRVPAGVVRGELGPRCAGRLPLARARGARLAGRPLRPGETRVTRPRRCGCEARAGTRRGAV